MSIYNQVLPYVYKITNKETGEFYIGFRSKNVKLNLTPNEDFLIKYFTSGVLKKQLIVSIDEYESKMPRKRILKLIRVKSYQKNQMKKEEG